MAPAGHLAGLRAEPVAVATADAAPLAAVSIAPAESALLPGASR